MKNEFDSAKIYEDENTLAFLDINPLTKGHCLVVPKQHFENIFDIPDELLGKIILTTKDISGRIKKSLKADGIRLSQSNGEIAGQVILHFHMHIIPRYQNDGIQMGDATTSRPQKADLNELKKLANEINSSA